MSYKTVAITSQYEGLYFKRNDVICEIIEKPFIGEKVNYETKHFAFKVFLKPLKRY